MTVLCLNCLKKPAQRIAPFGYLFCKMCQKKQQQYSVRETIEVTTEGIREERKAYETDILQRYKGDTPSLEFIKQYGATGFSKEELKRARNVNQAQSMYTDKTERYK